MLVKYKAASKVIARNLLTKRMNTYCTWLWDSVFINYNGYVFTCCHNQPGVIGNIYKQNLKHIWTKSIKLKIFRLMASTKSLHCFYACNIFPNQVKGNIDQAPVTESYPKRVWVLQGEFCNLDCVMCVQNHKSKIMIDNDILKKNIDWKKVDDIALQGGEILAMKNARQMYLWLTKRLNKKVNLITNGILINDDWADHLVRGSNWIQISVNAATKETHEIVNRKSSFTRVINNLKKMIDLKHQYGSDVEIIYKFTMVNENIHEIGKAIEFANSLGCDSIAFGYKNPNVPFLLNWDKKLKEEIRHEISRLVNSNLRIKIGMKRLEQLGLIEVENYTSLW